MERLYDRMLSIRVTLERLGESDILRVDPNGVEVSCVVERAINVYLEMEWQTGG